jgi:hypothetical protein
MKVPAFSTTMAQQRHDAEVEARQREYEATFRDGKRAARFYLVAEVDDGLPPIKQEISAIRHAAFTAFENVNPSYLFQPAPKAESVMNIDSDVAD